MAQAVGARTCVALAAVLMTRWPGAMAPLVAEEHVVQLGARENRDADSAWPDVNDTAITRIAVFDSNAPALRRWPAASMPCWTGASRGASGCIWMPMRPIKR